VGVPALKPPEGGVTGGEALHVGADRDDHSSEIAAGSRRFTDLPMIVSYSAESYGR
jgi:hypothetical protein